MYDICIIGHVTRDTTITPKHTLHIPGGTAFYMAGALRHLPPKVRTLVVTKTAEADKDAVEKFNSETTDIDIQWLPSRHTVEFENKYAENLNHRTQRVTAKADAFTKDDIKNVSAKVFHLGSLLADDYENGCMEELRKKGKVSIDIQGFLREVSADGSVVPVAPHRCKDILKHTDIVKLNGDETVLLTGTYDMTAAATWLHEQGPEEVIITLGDEGSIISAGGHDFHIPAYKPRNTADVTGCGDTYSAGYLWCRAQKATYKEAGEFAAAMCTLKIENDGPFSNSIDDVRTIMSK